MVRSKLPMNLRKTISRRALFGSGILFPLALKLGAKPANAGVSLSVGALLSLTGNSADLGSPHCNSWCGLAPDLSFLFIVVDCYSARHNIRKLRSGRAVEWLVTLIPKAGEGPEPVG